MVIFAGLVVAVGLVAGCGGSSARVLDTKTVLRTLEQAGFSNLKVRSNAEAMKQLAKRLHKPSEADNPLDQDWIYEPPFYLGPVTASRLPTVAMAKRSYAASPLPVPKADLPPGMDPTKLTLARVCNVLLISYNRNGSAVIRKRFDRAVELLKKQC